ncbi:HAMP domain-containing sensor histidine kinase [Sphingomonas sp. AOB5]|uniref:HAMP domain-containing sensor histidine kinase n=1 Tax=Sphingomonas sp. AOB5 TaxID=3034017 RepID=UPI0023F62D27|nr:HAMP domain-containing sensor histidine kinase [Sphingomonas sp. AOB5]MDF7774599.1 HAMP domain-containing sensor histidine kinase [Sphingomonas sp. AOB5]
MRISFTARIALLAIGLALVSSLALAGLVWLQTHDDAVEALRRDTVEESNELVAVWRSGGIVALERAIADARSGDDALVAEIVDASGTRIGGAGPDRLSFAPPPGRSEFRIAQISAQGDFAGQDVGFVTSQIGQHWIVTGRLLDDWERAQHAIERALILAVLLAIILGVAGGLVLARYVSRRLDHIAGTVDAVAAGDLTRRVPASGGDAFDRLALRINEMLNRIDRLMGELRIVTDSIAHDLRSPIARLRVRAETAATANDPAQREAALAGLVTETDLVTRMLSVLLEISRTEASNREALVPLDPATLIEALADLYEPVAEEAGIELETSVAPLPPVPLHRELLSQAIANLIDNALRHASSGGHISLSLTSADGAMRIAVADRGPGIAEADRAEALRRFGRLDSARSLPGAGLGLALVDAVAHLHGGRLELGDNAPGLIATLVLPLP